MVMNLNVPITSMTICWIVLHQVLSIAIILVGQLVIHILLIDPEVLQRQALKQEFLILKIRLETH